MATKSTARKPGKAKVTLPADLSPIVRALESAYRQIQAAYPDLPDATIVVKRDMFAWGHTTVAKVWAPHAKVSKDGVPVETVGDRFEIMISGENLRRGSEAVLGTLLHEAAHARNLGKGRLDTDVNGRHNALFKEVAESHGLTVKQAGWRGWTDTALSDEGRKRWSRTLRSIDLGLAKAAAAATKPDTDHLPGLPVTPVPPVGVTGVLTPPRRRGNRNLLVAICDCGHKIRLSRGVLETAKPKCQVCDTEFALA